jgi:diadenosine tetraphosphatase ApaH/serine/threonine PP2A family protein phosphatase
MFYMENNDYMAKLTIPPVGETTELKPRVIINPGSVGQPRDRNPHAAYAVFDSEANTWDYHRVEYDFTTTQDHMRKHDLPERHIVRLESGW